MARFIGAAALVIIVAGALYYRSYQALPFALGVLLTSAFNVARVFMIERAVQKAVDIGDSDAAAGKSYIRGQYIMRLVFTGAVLAIAAVVPENVISIWGAAAGIFTFQIAAIVVRILKIDIKYGEKGGYEAAYKADEVDEADEEDEDDEVAEAGGAGADTEE